MRLRTQFIITMCLFGIVLAAIAASAIITNYLVVKVMEQERRAFDIVRATGELDYLANEYLLYHESQQLGRWQERFASFTLQVSSLHVDKPEQQQLVANINLNKNRLKEVFESVVSARGSLSQNKKSAFDPVALQVSWSRMAVQTQGLEADALHLSRMLGQQADKLRYARDVLLYITVGLFGLFIIAIYMLTYRRVLKSIAELRAGTAVIGSGNLDFAIKEKRNDEIGELYQDFNRMATDLKVVTASKTDLEREISERKLAESQRESALKALADDLIATSHLQQIGARFVKAGELADVLGEIVDAAIAITHADMGNIQLLDPQSGCLRIAAYRGFEQRFLDFWNTVAEGQGNCGTAMKNAQRSIVENVSQSPIFAGTLALEVQLAANVRAVQSTPLVGHSGTLIGMLSTHWHVPYRPAQHDLQLLDLLAQEAVDIIELSRAKEALLESEKWLSAVFDGVSETLMLLDIEGKIIAANKMAALRFNQGKTDLVGKNIYDLIPVRFQKQRKELVLEMVSTRKPIKFHDRLEDVFLEIIFYPVFDAQGNVIQFVSFALDITERKQAEDALAEKAAQLQERSAQLEEINKELESFSYSVSHDLRAPLRAIDGFSRMILKKEGDKFDEETIRKFNTIRSNAQQMGQLIDDLLNLSRLGKQEMALVKLDMGSLSGEVWQELQVINSDRTLELTVKDMPEASGDRILIKQVYLNLLGNAIKFTKHCSPAKIEAGGYTKGNEYVYYIKDNGAGFDMAYYNKLFGVFQRLHSTDDYEGTGIGLAIVQRIIHRHGGRVWAEGEVDKGATFYFTLPGK